MGADWDGMKGSENSIDRAIRRDREEVTSANDDSPQLESLNIYLDEEVKGIGKMCDEMRRTMDQNNEQLKTMREQIIRRIEFHQASLEILTLTKQDIERYLNNEWNKVEKEPIKYAKGDDVRMDGTPQMTHLSHYCGCDPDHTPMHTRGENACRHRTDPKEILIRDTEEFLKAEGPTMPAASSLLQRWLDIS